MDAFQSPLFDLDDPFLFPDHIDMTIFQDLPHQGSSSSLFTTSTDPAVLPGENLQVFTAAATATATATGKMKEKRGRKPAKDGEDRSEKRAAHREIERQRRQDMAHLYASLRNLLPLEYIKGKRAVNDHIHEAINYIGHKKATIRELELKRNKLRNQVGETSTTRRFSSNITFTVGSCSDGGIEILMGSDLADDRFPLSRVMKVLLNHGLVVVNCTYTKLDQKLHCAIRTDAGSPRLNDGDLRLLRENLDAKVADWRSSGARSTSV